MCGIVAYTGFREACPIVLKAMKSLEYRGYDSAGLALTGKKGEISTWKIKGRVSDLEKLLAGVDVRSCTGMGHTRWATHGEPSDRNAHPHQSASGRLVMVHNGIIENHGELKKDLLRKNYKFYSDTDTEVLINFIEDILSEHGDRLEEALQIAMNSVLGSFAIVLMDRAYPGRIIAARRGSPLVIGIGAGEYFLASDASAFVEYTRQVVYVGENELALVTSDELILKNAGGEQISPTFHTVTVSLADLDKGGWPHFMLKEIVDQADTLRDSMEGRLGGERGTIVLPGFQQHLKKFVHTSRIVIVGCGTSWHAGLVAEYIFEDLCRLPVEVEYASEFRYRNPLIHPGDILIALSQSGETADTIVAIEQARKQGAFIVAVVNSSGSTIARMADCRAYLHAGPEIGVASTKAFTAQLTVLTMMAMAVARARGTVDSSRYRRLVAELRQVPAKVRKILMHDGKIRHLALACKDTRNVLYLGRGMQFPIALEGALKLKEISYIHAEGYPAGEMKHGPIALVDESLPVICIALLDENYPKMMSNINEVIARKGKVIALVSEGDEVLPAMADFCIEIPVADPIVAPILSVIPLQLLAYHIGVARGCDVDKPRNLAKSVTVE